LHPIHLEGEERKRSKNWFFFLLDDVGCERSRPKLELGGLDEDTRDERKHVEIKKRNGATTKIDGLKRERMRDEMKEWIDGEFGTPCKTEIDERRTHQSERLNENVFNIL